VRNDVEYPKINFIKIKAKGKRAIPAKVQKNNKGRTMQFIKRR